MATTLWSQLDGLPHSMTLDGITWLDSDGEVRANGQAGGLGLGPVNCENAVAVLLVPDEMEGSVSRNGVPLAAGLHLLQHADEFTIGDRPFWTSADSQPQETTYSLKGHSADAFCFLTKARLREGERITICPGRPGQPCGTIYKQAAWQTMVAQSAQFRCPNCSFDPRSAAWKPPQRGPRSSLAGVLSLLKREKLT